jgi:putative addiction module component (TIGR02574 family)
VEHTAIPEPAGFSELSKIEQIRYVQALWDRILEESDDLPIPESHLALLKERLEERQRNPRPTRSAYAILDELASRSR